MNKRNYFLWVLLFVGLFCPLRHGVAMEKGVVEAVAAPILPAIARRPLIIESNGLRLDLSKLEIFKRLVEEGSTDGLKALCLDTLFFTDLKMFLRHEMFANPEKYVKTLPDNGRYAWRPYAHAVNRLEELLKDPKTNRIRIISQRWLLDCGGVRDNYFKELSNAYLARTRVSEYIKYDGRFYLYALVGFINILIYPSPYGDWYDLYNTDVHLSAITKETKEKYLNLLVKSGLLLSPKRVIQTTVFQSIRNQVSRFVDANQDVQRPLEVVLVIGDGKNIFRLVHPPTSLIHVAELYPSGYSRLRLLVDDDPLVCPDVISDINNPTLHRVLEACVQHGLLKVMDIINETNIQTKTLLTQKTRECFFRILADTGSISDKHDKVEDQGFITAGFVEKRDFVGYKKPERSVTEDASAYD